MKYSLLRTLFITLAISISSSALAQYIWLDENGHKQYSDQPPPVSVPKDKILKFGGKTSDDDNPGSTPAKVKQPESVADRELSYKKRQAEAEKKAKKEEEQAKEAATTTENCKRLKEYKKGLDSGLRVSEMNADGTTGYMTDEKRAQELNQINKDMSGCN